MSIRKFSTASISAGANKSTKLWDQETFRSGMFAIATVSLTANQTTVGFSSIPSGYTHLQLRGILRSSSGSMNGVIVRFNSDSSSNYIRHVLGGDGASATASASGTGTNAGMGYYPGGSDPSSFFGAFVLDILDYTSTTKTKTLRNLYGAEMNNSSGSVGLYSSLWFKTPEAITSMSITAGSGDFVAYSHLALYGIKAA